jgi:hypothetical protein
MDDKEQLTEVDLNQVRSGYPAWDIAPTSEGYEGRLGSVVLKRRSIPGLEMAIRITGIR